MASANRVYSVQTTVNGWRPRIPLPWRLLGGWEWGLFSGVVWSQVNFGFGVDDSQVARDALTSYANKAFGMGILSKFIALNLEVCFYQAVVSVVCIIEVR